MHITRITQDLYPVSPSPVSARNGAGPQPRSAGTQGGTRGLPVERVVEGEWQKVRGAVSATVFERIGRQRPPHQQDQHPLPPDTQRAIEAYRSHAMSFNRPVQANISRIDYYA